MAKENYTSPGNAFFAEQYGPDLYELINNSLETIASKYRETKHTPLLITKTWQGVWDKYAEGSKIEVPQLKLSTDEIEAVEKEGDVLFFLPENTSLNDLKKVFPQWVHYPGKLYQIEELEISKIKTDEGRNGWRRADSALLSPNRYLGGPGSSERLNGVVDQVKESGRDVIDVREYLILSYFSKTVNYHYLDEDSTSFLGYKSVGDTKVNLNGLFFRGTGRPNIYYDVYIPSQLGVRSSKAI